MQLLSPPQTVTRDPKQSHLVRLAAWAASMLVLTNLELDVTWAVTTSVELAGRLVNLVGLIVAALQLDKALEAHLDGVGPFCRGLSGP